MELIFRVSQPEGAAFQLALCDKVSADGGANWQLLIFAGASFFRLGRKILHHGKIKCFSMLKTIFNGFLAQTWYHCYYFDP